MSNKNAFLILRVDKEFKDKLVKVARNRGRNLSQFLRDILEKFYDKKN